MGGGREAEADKQTREGAKIGRDLVQTERLCSNFN